MLWGSDNPEEPARLASPPLGKTALSLRGGMIELQIAFEPYLGVVQVVAQGELNNVAWADIVPQMVELARQHDCYRVLCDYRKTIVVESTLGIYHSPDIVRQAEMASLFRIALVYARDEADHHFWETAARNRGMNVRIFSNRQKALEWLVVE